MAKGLSALYKNLYGYQRLSEGGAIWINFADEEGCCISSIKYRAEGYRRKTTQEYMRALSIAYGSHCELEIQILLSGDRGSAKSDDLKNLQRDRGDSERMLKALMRS